MIRDRIYRIRQQMSLSQEEFGALLGIKRSVVSKQENGRCYPSVAALKLLADKYNISMDYLLCGRGRMFYAPTEADIQSDQT